MSKQKTTRAANDVASAIRAAAAELEGLDREIAELQERRREVIDAPRPRKDTIAAIRQRIQKAAADGRSRLDRMAAQTRHPSAVENFDPLESLDYLPQNRDYRRVNGPLLLALIGDRMADELERRIEEDERFDDALTDAERDQELKAVDARIADAEARRTALENELAAAGFLQGNSETEQPRDDRGMAAFAAEHERQRQEQIAELRRATPDQSPVSVRTATADGDDD